MYQNHKEWLEEIKESEDGCIQEYRIYLLLSDF